MPIAGMLAACAAAAVVFVANWNELSTTFFNSAGDGGDIIAGLIGLAMLLVGSATTVAMLLPGVIGIAIAEVLAIRSWIFHALNGAVSIWVGRTLMVAPEPPSEFQGQPAVLLAAGLAAGLVYWVIAGHGAGLAGPARRAEPPAGAH
jgi:hypothetical protein